MQDDPVTWLERHIQADFGVAPEIMRISMTGEDTQALPIIVDAVRRAYLIEIVQKDTTARQKRLDKLRGFFAEHDSRLRVKRDSLKRMAKNVGLPNKDALNAKQELNEKYLYEMQSLLLKRESDLMTAKLELLVYKGKEKATAEAAVPTATIEEYYKKDTVVKAFEQEIMKLEVLLAEFRERSPNPEREPAFKQAQQKIETAKAEIAKRREKLLPLAIAQTRNAVRDGLELQRVQLKDRVEFLTTMKKELNEEIQRRSKDIKVFKEEVVDLAWLQDEIARA